MPLRGHQDGKWTGKEGGGSGRRRQEMRCPRLNNGLPPPPKKSPCPRAWDLKTRGLGC